MAKDSKIEWCEHTANLWWGCTEVHAGCDNCYARVLSHRWGHELWGKDAPRKIIKNTFLDLDRYQKEAASLGEVHRVFVGSMMDIFEKPMPAINHKMESLAPLQTGFYRDLLFRYISEGQYPNLLFLLLTKRPSNINKYIPESWKTDPPKNVMFGTSPVDQETADKLIPQLLSVKGKKFLSVEPMLNSVEMDSSWLIGHPQYIGQIDWVICGGESGSGKRPFNAEWARSLRDQCNRFYTPFFMKQIDKVQEIPEDLLIRQYPVINGIIQ